MYNWQNIVWIKNVTPKNGTTWAYDDKTCNESFFLNWSTTKGGGAKTPRVGDVIVLFQTPKQINGIKNGHVHLTHLVSPVDSIIYEDEAHPDFKYCRKVKLISIAQPINAIPNPGYYNFHKPNRGPINPIRNLANRINMTLDETRQDLWWLFQKYLCAGISLINFPNLNDIGEYGVMEGDKVTKEHVRLEQTKRNLEIVKLAKNIAFQRDGKLLCECCKFDFVKTYGSLGHKFIEGHHKVFINNGPRETKIGDIALVCSNCHRMLHRRNVDGSFNSIKQLQKILQDNISV
jgi:hypothetical protein